MTSARPRGYVQACKVGALVLGLIVATGGCRSDRAPDTGSVTGAGGAIAGGTETPAASTAGASPGTPTDVTNPGGAPVAAADDPGVEEPLAAELAELQPESPNVKLRVEVQPPGIRAAVWWGRKRLGIAPVSIDRPRRSGPIDLLVKADGYLDYHTRMFTDRNESLVVNMVAPEEANTLLGYKHGADGGAPAGANPDGGAPADAKGDAGARGATKRDAAGGATKRDAAGVGGAVKRDAAALLRL